MKVEIERYVEKRKISYFVLAHNLIQHWISPNQEMTYPIQPVPSFPASKTGWAAKTTLFSLRRRPEQTRL